MLENTNNSQQPLNKSVQFTSKLNQSEVSQYHVNCRLNGIFVLNPRLKQTNSRVIKLLDRITPQSRLYSKLFHSTKTHDKNWVQWKADSCKSYELARHTGTDSKTKRKMEGSLASLPGYLGNDEMTKLWANGQNVPIQQKRYDLETVNV